MVGVETEAAHTYCNNWKINLDQLNVLSASQSRLVPLVIIITLVLPLVHVGSSLINNYFISNTDTSLHSQLNLIDHALYVVCKLLCAGW